jgi:hypothetical protein
MAMKGDCHDFAATAEHDISDHEASVELARALGGIGASPDYAEHRERMHGAIDELRITRC